jgi:hypothetical protein
MINLGQQQQLEVFKIDLDLPPKQRFVAPTKRFAKEIMALLEAYENALIKGKIPD